MWKPSSFYVKLLPKIDPRRCASVHAGLTFIALGPVLMEVPVLHVHGARHTAHGARGLCVIAGAVAIGSIATEVLFDFD